MKKIILRNKSIALLLFLFGYSNLFGYGGSSACSGRETMGQRVREAHRYEICKEKSQPIRDRLNENHSFLYLKVPELGNEYLEYENEELAENLETDRRKEKAIPIYIELDEALLNPKKEDRENYQASSKFKERIISENSTIRRRNCSFFSIGSEYLFAIRSGRGLFSVILYFNYRIDVARSYYLGRRYNTDYAQYIPKVLFDQFIHRSFQKEVNFEAGKIYEIEIKINPNSGLPRGSYNAQNSTSFETMNTVPGFTITLKELPPNTKFAFDGKDDVGKTYEQVKKEFILYDKSAEKN